MMGGIDTDIEGATPLPGLYAAGECACVSINGANRLGSNSLPELLVFGKRAARAAVSYAAEQPPPDADLLETKAVAESERLRGFLDAPGGESTAAIREEMNHAMEEGAGIFRQESSLRQACDTIAELKERFLKVSVSDQSRVFNTELVTALELEAMLDVAETVAHSGLARTESRGSHQRTDYPDRDDDRFLKHSLAYRTDGEPNIDYSDVAITRWPPGKRAYGN